MGVDVSDMNLAVSPRDCEGVGLEGTSLAGREPGADAHGLFRMRDVRAGALLGGRLVGCVAERHSFDRGVRRTGRLEASHSDSLARERDGPARAC